MQVETRADLEAAVREHQHADDPSEGIAGTLTRDDRVASGVQYAVGGASLVADAGHADADATAPSMHQEEVGVLRTEN